MALLARFLYLKQKTEVAINIREQQKGVSLAFLRIFVTDVAKLINLKCKRKIKNRREFSPVNGIFDTSFVISLYTCTSTRHKNSLMC